MISRTLHLVLQCLDLRIRIVHELIHLLTERIVLASQAFREVLLIDDLLRRLIAMECQAATGTLHDDCWTQAAKYRRLVVF